MNQHSHFSCVSPTNANLQPLVVVVDRMAFRMCCFPLPTIAALRGHWCAAGGMMGLALDFRFMSSDSGPSAEVKGFILAWLNGRFLCKMEKKRGPAFLVENVHSKELYT